MVGYDEKTSLNLIHALLQYCDIDSAELDEEDKVLLSIDGKATFLIHLEGSLVHFTGFLGRAAETKRFYLGLLQENFKSCSRMDGYRYAIDPETGDMVMSLTIRSEGLSQAGFIDEFEQFVAFSEHWLKSLLAGDEGAMLELPAVDEQAEQGFSIENAGLFLTKV